MSPLLGLRVAEQKPEQPAAGTHPASRCLAWERGLSPEKPRQEMRTGTRCSRALQCRGN